MPKWLRGSAILLGVLALIYAVAQIPRPEEKSPLPVVPERLEKLAIARPPFSATFEYTNDHWRLRQPLDFPADDGAVASLLAGLRGMTGGDVLTRRAESHGLYDVTDAAGVRVSLWAPGAKEPLEWILGKTSADGNHAYLRLPKSDAVFLVGGWTREGIEPNLNAWREKRILTASSEEIVEVKAEPRGGAFTLSKDSDGWTVNGRPALAEKVTAFLEALRELTAEDFIDPPLAGAQSPRSPTLRLTVRYASGRSETLRVGPENPKTKRAIVQRDGCESLFSLSAFHFSPERFQSKTYLKK